LPQSDALLGFELYLEDLVANCVAHPAIDGLVLFGSTADRNRVDEWSDHDFAIVCQTEFLEALRSDLTWLPRFESIAFAAREHHDGFKAVYSNGAVIEFAVVDRVQLATFDANSWEVAYDRLGGLDKLMTSIADKAKLSDEADPVRDFTVFLASLVIGVGRARRGETLSASSVVRGQAVDHLLAVISTTGTVVVRPDNLDVRRRFELAYPRAKIGPLLDRDPETAARELLVRAEALLGGRWPAYPAQHVEVVRSVFGWQT
jgi:hypothetical protein